MGVVSLLGANAVRAVAADDDYARLASAISSPLYPTWDEARAGYSDNSVILRMEFARVAVAAFKTSDADLSKVASNALTKLEATRSTLTRIRGLDKNTPDYLGVVDKAVKASPALVRSNSESQKLLPGDQDAINQLAAKALAELVKAGVNQYQLTEEWSGYRRHYAELREASWELESIARKRPCLYGIGMTSVEKDDGPKSAIIVEEVIQGSPAAKAWLGKGDRIVAVDGEPIASGGVFNPAAAARVKAGTKDSVIKFRVEKSGRGIDIEIPRSLRLDDTAGLLSLSLSGSCDEAFDTDDLTMTNTSEIDLTNCTIVVRLISEFSTPGDEHAQQHIHFVKHWPKNHKLVAMYHNAGSKRIARNESYKFVQKVSVKLYSDQYQGTTKYSYWNSPERKADLANYCKNNVEFSGKFITETDGFVGKGDGLYHSDGAVRVWLGQVEGKGIPELSPSEVKVTVKKGRKRIAAAWDAMTLKGGGPFPFQTFFSAKFNGIAEPDSYEVVFSFHGTNYQHVVTFGN